LRELFATLDEYFTSQRTGAMEIFRVRSSSPPFF
jgi:hypothetical protein